MTTGELLIYIAVVLVLAGALAFWLFLESQYKYRVRIKDLVKGRKIVKDFRAKPFVDIDGISWWKIAGERDKSKKLLPLPPEEAIEMNTKGKKCAECYRTEFGEVIWLKEEGDVKGIDELEKRLLAPPKDLTNIPNAEIKKEKIGLWKEKLRSEWFSEHNIIAPFHAINTKQRMIYFNNIRKAEERRKGFDWKTQILPAVSLGVLVLLVIAGMVFWGDLAKPAIQVNQQAIELKKLDLEIVTELREIKTGQQRINDKLGIE